MILTVDYIASNLDLVRNDNAIKFNPTFTAMLAEIIYRPAVISSTAHIYSSFNNESLAHCDDLGCYKVIFDFLNKNFLDKDNAYPATSTSTLDKDRQVVMVRKILEITIIFMMAT
ncbi:MAG: hypothetical protein ACJA0E_000194 [Bermanella sp.]